MISEASPADDLTALWAQWMAQRESATRNKIIDRYRWLVRAMAARALRERNHDSDLDRSELEQLGFVGLLESIESYVPRPGRDFAVFAHKRVYGSIIDGINRSSDIRAQLSAAYDARIERIRSIEGQSEKRDRLNRLVDIAVGLAIGIMLEDTGLFVDSTAEPVRGYTNNELEVLRDQFKRTVEQLPGKQSDVVKHHYYHDIPFTEIAELLGISKARVSQLHASALRTIRDRLSQLGLVDDFY